jgi:hypothetical protein
MSLMHRVWGALALLISGIAIVACGSAPVAAHRTPQISAGTWAGKSKGASVTLSLSSDGRFQTVFNGGRYRAVVRGRATIQESILVLEAAEIDGQPATKNQLPAKFKFTPEWSTLTAENGLTISRKI